jgi:hypothetical protein
VRLRKRKPAPEPEVLLGHTGTFFTRKPQSWVKCGCTLWFPAQRTVDGAIDSPQWDAHLRSVTS